MKELIKKELQNTINYLYKNELNFNNADTTSKQLCYSKEEIKELIKEVLQDELGTNGTKN